MGYESRWWQKATLWCYLAGVSSIPSNECIVNQSSHGSSGNSGKGHYGSVQTIFSS